MGNDLLQDPLISVSLRDAGTKLLSLPEVLAALSVDEVGDFPALRPHQEHPWFALLVQLGAIAMHRGGAPVAPSSPDAWQDLLRALTPAEPTAWQLVVPDASLPAFLQPPIPDGLSSLSRSAETPDALDVLVLTKNHDLKAARAPKDVPELWLYALISLQTMDGYLGAGNYGIARMNRGLGSRAFVGAAPGRRWGQRFQRDIALLLAATELESDSGISFDPQGPALLWLEPWDGTSERSLMGLNPWFIEICRRVRLAALPDGSLFAHKGTSRSPRLDGEDFLGQVGDPWIPIDVKEAKALTLGGAQGFNYKQVTRLLNGQEYRAPLCGRPQRGDTLLLMSALVRGQGKTEGFHERVVPVPGGRFTMPGWQSRFARRAKARIERIDAVRLSVLANAIRNLLATGEASGGGARDSRPQRHLDAFERDIDAAFFPSIWRALDATDEASELAAEQEFETFLLERARFHLEEAINSTPLPAARRYKAIAAAERVFAAAARKHLPSLQPAPNATRSTGATESP
jgi:CRISPR system Cascade subunit CasA